MRTSIREFNEWLKKPEGQNIEFKSAKGQYSDKNLSDYCAALSNERGGKLILGVSPTGRVVGTKVFQGKENTKSHLLLRAIKIRVDLEELIHPDGRVLIFHVPSRPPGRPIQSNGDYRYPMRAGESLVEMDEETLRKIFQEQTPDFSALPVSDLSLDDLDQGAVERLRQLWAKKSSRKEVLSISVEEMLRRLELLTKEGLNYAALILLGKKTALSRLLPDTEIIFEWRQDGTKTAYDYRKEWREAFLNVYESVWESIDGRNMRVPFQEGFIQRDIYAFEEKSIREAVLNAITHRDYSIRGKSVFIKASSERFSITSPGGFMPDITVDNILDRCSWRNRRLAEVLQQAGLVERSGQGMKDIFEETIRGGKGVPAISEIEGSHVRLEIPAQIKDKSFILYLEKVANDRQISFSLPEIIELESIRENKKTKKLQFRDKFLSLGIIEQIGARGKGVRYILSHQYYAATDERGIHTRLKGIGRQKAKELIKNHIKRYRRGDLSEFLQAFPELKYKDVSNLLQELRKGGEIKHVGSKRGGYWVFCEKQNS